MGSILIILGSNANKEQSEAVTRARLINMKVHLILSFRVMTFLRYLPTIAMLPLGHEAFKDCCTCAETSIRVIRVKF